MERDLRAGEDQWKEARETVSESLGFCGLSIFEYTTREKDRIRPPSFASAAMTA